MRGPVRPRVWLRAHALSRQVAGSFSERTAVFAPALLSKAIRAAAAAPDHIAAACGPPASDDGLRSLAMAVTSLTELETHLTLAADVGLITRWRYEELTDECA